MFKLFWEKKDQFLFMTGCLSEQIDDPVFRDLEVDAIIVVLRDVLIRLRFAE